MKKIIAILLTLVITLSLAMVAFANPGQNPNQNPGSPEVTDGGFTVRVTGGGNNLVIDILQDGVVVYPRIPRAGNGTFSQTFVTTSGHSIFIRVQGNSLRLVTVTAPEPPEPPARTVVNSYSFYRFVRLNRVDSYFTGITETSREFVNGNAVKHNWVRTNTVPGVNGQAVITGAQVTGTLNYEFVRNYVEQFERSYEWVDVTVWSDGTRDEVVRAASEHVRGGLVDGEAYYTGPYAGSREIEAVSTGTVVLHMGYQGGVYRRFATLDVGDFTVGLELHDTSSTPTITFTITDVDLAAL